MSSASVKFLNINICNQQCWSSLISQAPVIQHVMTMKSPVFLIYLVYLPSPLDTDTSSVLSGLRAQLINIIFYIYMHKFWWQAIPGWCGRNLCDVGIFVLNISYRLYLAQISCSAKTGSFFSPTPLRVMFHIWLGSTSTYMSFAIL